MALNVKINLKDRYEITELSEDMTSGNFTTVLNDKQRVTLGVQISKEEHPLMPNVYNLSFGPLDEHGKIDDHARLSHADHSKVFSTILFISNLFLNEYPDRYLGIDGSNNARAYLYYKCVQNNCHYLSQFFEIYGINYYIRILRNNDDGAFIDEEDIIAVPKSIYENKQICYDKLHNYFIFKAKRKEEDLS